jgi:hypothetical protein
LRAGQCSRRGNPLLLAYARLGDRTAQDIGRCHVQMLEQTDSLRIDRIAQPRPTTRVKSQGRLPFSTIEGCIEV